MGIKKYKPTTPGLRGMTVSTFEEITTKTPEKSLTVTLKKHAGRNVRGKITVRHRGGGYRPKYRIIDFKRTKDGIPATVKTIEYDPNRTANIALLAYADGEKRYIIAPNKLKVGDVVESGPNADIKPGNALPIANIPLGTIIHNIELKPGKVLVVTLESISKADGAGNRDLTWTVNGYRRVVSIKDKQALTKSITGSQIQFANQDDAKEIGANIPGTIIKILVKKGDIVKQGQPIAIIEAMKMETNVLSTGDGEVANIYVKEGDSVKSGQLIALLEDIQ